MTRPDPVPTQLERDLADLKLLYVAQFSLASQLKPHPALNSRRDVNLQTGRARERVRLRGNRNMDR